MRYIDNTSIDPYFNLAAEEYLLKHTEEEYFSLWRDEPCIIVGKNQNTLSEINTDYVKENNIKVVRRLTGGGAVFHDLGNINFTFIVNDNHSYNDFYKFVKPIIEVLRQLGVEAEFSGRNDMLIEGKKFSGNAQCKHKNRVMHHGTLLFSSNMADLSGALKPKAVKFSDKSVKSVASRVTNISEHLPKALDVLEFKEAIFKYIIAEEGKQVEYFSKEEVEIINKLKEEKYSTWQWNYGKSPRYNFYNEKKFPAGTVEVTLQVTSGCIENIKIYGDFFGKLDIHGLEEYLEGKPHNEEDIRKALVDLDLDSYITNITLDNFMEILF
ncbi:lipoate-protein ligase A [Clostridium amylolyticum]|uniref:lipoate--protein ligase n=1 Tax=Clostridium amylolyticum TaxID=1121298 RepID=A0A1M6INQ5_9CLOT|nr:lipoate--protein ligase [Clostridium amylolyticum]SHJ36040.1 lipoate-protein ligase A [Clostridium amylolyticum]